MELQQRNHEDTSNYMKSILAIISLQTLLIIGMFIILMRLMKKIARVENKVSQSIPNCAVSYQNRESDDPSYEACNEFECIPKREIIVVGEYAEVQTKPEVIENYSEVLPNDETYADYEEIQNYRDENEKVPGELNFFIKLVFCYKFFTFELILNFS